MKNLKEIKELIAKSEQILLDIEILYQKIEVEKQSMAGAIERSDFFMISDCMIAISDYQEKISAKRIKFKKIQSEIIDLF